MRYRNEISRIILGLEEKASAVSKQDDYIDETLLLRRRMDSDDFNFLVTLLQFPFDSILRKFFTCSWYQFITMDGSIRSDGVIMDGTDIGILNKLPVTLPYIRSWSPPQFILATKLRRDFLDAIFISGNKNKEEMAYPDEFLKSIEPHASRLFPCFFWCCINAGESAKALVIRCFTGSCFEFLDENVVHKIGGLDFR